MASSTPPTISPAYQIKVYARSLSDTIIGHLPESFDTTTSATWQDALQSALSIGGLIGLDKGGVAGKISGLLTATGLGAGQLQASTAQVWKASEPLKMSLTMAFFAHSNAKAEVVSKVAKLMTLTAPDLTANSIFSPPGPAPSSAALGALSEVPVVGGLVQKAASILGDKVNIEVGLNFMSFTNVIVKDVRASWTSKMSKPVNNYSAPLQATVTLSFETSVVVAKSDILKIFGLRK